METAQALVAVDVGNSRIKLGLFPRPLPDGMPEPSAWLSLEPDRSPADIDGWLPAKPSAYEWLVASVNRPAASRLLEYLAARGAAVRQLTAKDLPLEIAVRQPELVGIDRLVAAVAANRLRAPDRPAIIADVGTAITVDLVSAEGVFRGGAILPGIAISARALDQFTDLVPLVPVSELAEPQPPLGTSTAEAVRSGLYWGAIGAVRELARQLDDETTGAELFLTGGAAPAVARLLLDRQGQPARWVPHLVLGGIVLSAGH